MPALKRVKDQAKSVMCQSRLREWGLLHKFYTDDNNGYFYRGWGVGETDLWMNAMRPYYKDNWDMLLCPTAKREMRNSSDFGTFKAAYRTIATPGGGSHRYVFSYSENSWINYMTSDRGARLVEWFWKNAYNVQGANNIPVFGDATWHDAWPLDTDPPTLTPDAYGIGDKGTTGEMNHFVINRHNGFINMLFMDWSVRPVGLKENWTLQWHRTFNIAGPYTKAGGVQPNEWPEWLKRFKDY
jgi:prepilin-type processing-associated H-X9-DG protein